MAREKDQQIETCKMFPRQYVSPTRERHIQIYNTENNSNSAKWTCLLLLLYTQSSIFFFVMAKCLVIYRDAILQEEAKKKY